MPGTAIRTIGWAVIARRHYRSWYNPGDVKGSDTHIQQLNEQERYPD